EISGRNKLNPFHGTSLSAQVGSMSFVNRPIGAGSLSKFREIRKDESRPHLGRLLFREGRRYLGRALFKRAARSRGNFGTRRATTPGSCGGCKRGAAARAADGCGRAPKLTTASRCFGCGANTGKRRGRICSPIGACQTSS